MANKRKRSRVQATSAADAKPTVVQSEARPKKKKALFSKTLTTDSAKSAAPVDAKPKAQRQERPVKMVDDIAPVDGAKKKKKKKSKSSGAATTVAATGKKATKAKASEIDDLFASLKTEKQKKSIAEEQQKLAKKEEERHEKKEKERLQQQIKKLEAQNTNSTAGGLNPDPRPVRYDEDGLAIYTESSLQIGKGGDTKDCPFDCWCCF
ncbi:hypothetical protein PRNP1_003280 [Phytophthora ramorum]